MNAKVSVLKLNLKITIFIFQLIFSTAQFVVFYFKSQV